MSYLSRVLDASPHMTEIPQRSLLEHAVSKPIPLATDALLLSFLNRSPVRHSPLQSFQVSAAFKPETRVHPADIPPWTPPKVKLQEPPQTNLWRAHTNAITKGAPLVWQDIKSTFSSFMSAASYQDVWSTRFDQLLQKLPGVGPQPSRNSEATIHRLHTSQIDQE